MARTELGRFLRDRREALRPGDVGLPAGPRRRTPGLRREEVADLAAMSVEYYARLEQARGPQPSRRILDALTGALRLSPAERTHLFRLADARPAAPPGPPRIVRPHIAGLLHRVDAAAVVTSAAYDIIAWNPLAEALLTGLRAEPNLARRRFLGGPVPSTAGTAHSTAGPAHSTAGPAHSTAGTVHSTAGTVHSTAGTVHSTAGPAHSTAGPAHSTAGTVHSTDRPAHSTAGIAAHSTAGPVHSTGAEEFGHIAVARLRAAADRYPRDERLADLLDDLRASEEFRHVWDLNPVRAPGHRSKTFEHPRLGPISVDCDILEVPDDDQQVVFITADPGSRSARALRALAA